MDACCRQVQRVGEEVRGKEAEGREGRKCAVGGKGREPSQLQPQLKKRKERTHNDEHSQQSERHRSVCRDAGVKMSAVEVFPRRKALPGAS